MEPVLGKKNVDQIIESIRRIEAVPNIRELSQLLMVRAG
jgi:hypothetical protein